MFTRCRFPETEKLSPPVLQLNEVTFSYKPERVLLKNVNFDIQLDSRIAIVGANGAGKSTLCVHVTNVLLLVLTLCGSIKLLTGELTPKAGHVNRNGRLRM